MEPNAPDPAPATAGNLSGGRGRCFSQTGLSSSHREGAVGHSAPCTAALPPAGAAGAEGMSPTCSLRPEREVWAYPQSGAF